MPIFPQIGDNAVITQLPYSVKLEYETVYRDVESGMRWAFPRRGSGLSGYPVGPIGRFDVQFSRVSDANLATLEAFFVARKGRYEEFEFVDPGGNMLQYSEDFSDATWDKGSTIAVVTSVTDPFRQSSARSLQGSSSNNVLMAVAGPASGGLNGYVLCASVWVNVRDAGQRQMHIGFVDSGFSAISGTTYTNLPYETWTRISHTATFWNDNYVRIIIGGYGTWPAVINYFFGAQVVAMKGEGAYVKTPGNYAYHQRCRFDTDKFEVRVEGPNQNAISLPIAEYNV